MNTELEPVAQIVVPSGRDRGAGDVTDLVDSIRDLGLLQPLVVTADGVLVAGLRRLTAIRALGWAEAPVTVAHQLDDATACLRAELEENTCRRDLSPVEAAYARQRRAETLRPLADKGGRPPKHTETTCSNVEPVTKGRVRQVAAEGLGYGASTLDKVDEIVRTTTDPDVSPAIRATATDALTALEDPGANVNKAAACVKRAKRDEELPAPPPPSALAEHDLILADPPWRYDWQKSHTRDIENHYPTMCLDDIKALEPPAAKDCILYLWATVPMNLEALQVMDAWGFTYKSGMVWVKDRVGMGYWFRQQHELLLVGTRGKPRTPDEDLRHSSVLEAPRTEHSAKPTEVYELIENAYPHLTKVEMFARSSRDGWNAWGNQA